MFWLDYLEHNGKLYLIGKVKDKSSGAWILACLSIGGIQRNIFVLPCQLRVMQEENEVGETEIVEMDVVFEKQDVYDDFDRIRKKMCIRSWKARWVKRNYAFDMKDIPKEAEWMKVLYSYESKFSSSVRLVPNSTNSRRTSDSDGCLFAKYPQDIRNKYMHIRTLRAQVENHGPLLARNQGC